MIRLPRYRRMALLTEGRLGVFTSKTAAVLLRYRGDDVVGVVDSTAAGRELKELIPFAPPRPIAPDVEAALGWSPDALVVGVAPVGGELPAEMRRAVLAALRAGVDVVSGLHTLLEEDAELAEAARRSGATIHDVRRAPPGRPIAAGRARGTRCRRVLTVGTDANVGKMVTALELSRAGRRRGLSAAFVATGQTGIMVEGWGAALDHVVSDFVAGVAEALVMQVADSDAAFIEGQGSIFHPAYSGVTLSLLHGVCPDAMVLVHHLGRTHYRFDGSIAMAGIAECIRACETLAEPLHRARVAAIAVNSHGVEEAEARRAAEELSRSLGLPVADVWRDGAERLLAAVLSSGGQGGDER